ncbi:ESF1 homolog [Thalassophryne amazonica]|uniref:ESF1 homolog n=1 Tax=Thalassophryne amazonica TaxID=390379 RepID=UPI0014720E42|nr:ESF1 homolog [Thalassophryne amazonica]
MSSSKKKAGGADERFLRVQKDPRFWEMPERERKVKIDKRFQSMFYDERFKVTYTVDKRGRPVNRTSTEDLRRFYKLSDEEDAAVLQAGEKKKKLEKTERKSKKRGADEEEEEPPRGVKHKGEEPPRGVRHKGEEPPRGVRHKGEEPPQGVRHKGEEPPQGVRHKGEEPPQGVKHKGEEPPQGVKHKGEEPPQGVKHKGEEPPGSVGAPEEDDEEEDESDSGTESSSDLDSDGDSDSGPDLARGKGNVETSSDEDDEDEVDVILRKEDEELAHDWGELCKDAPQSNEVSARLAVCNMDWDRIRAKDLLALLNSFTPKGGAVLSVKIYPSEFGKERLKSEETTAPAELQALPDDSEDDTEEERVYREKMRDYQFKRLKYYYAVVECDSPGTASKIYEDCDGYEYESSCSVLDLRFIPDNVTFDDEPKDVATELNLTTYTPELFTSSATATSKVQLTWDETNHARVTAMNRKFNKDDLLDLDFRAYLASSSEDDYEDEQQDTAEDKQTNVEKSRKKSRSEEQIAKYRNLLKGIADKEKKLQEDNCMEMQVTWVPGLKETTEQLVKKKLEGKESLTPWEKFLQKKKQRKTRKQKSAVLSDDKLPPDVDLDDPFFKEERHASEPKKKPKLEEEKQTAEEEELQRQKAEMALLMDDADDVKHKHFNYAKIVEQQNLSKKKRKKLQKKKSGESLEDEDHFQVDVKDTRFQAMFTSHLYSLDPSHPSYRNTRATQTILAEKQRRRDEEQLHLEDAISAHKATPTQEEAGSAAVKKAMDPTLSLLIKSIKSKTQQFQSQKKQTRCPSHIQL